MSAQERPEPGSKECAEAEIPLMRAALLEAGVDESLFTLTISGPGHCPVAGCKQYHASLGWANPDPDIIWKAFQLVSLELGTPTVCYRCWDLQIADDNDGCQAIGLEQDCGRPR